MTDQEIEQLKTRLEVQADTISQHITLQHKMQMRINQLEKIINEEESLKEFCKKMMEEGKDNASKTK